MLAGDSTFNYIQGRHYKASSTCFSLAKLLHKSTIEQSELRAVMQLYSNKTISQHSEIQLA